MWVKEERVQRLICGDVRMNRTGRDHVMQTSRKVKEKWVLVLSSVTDNVDCLFLHLRESLRLWEKPTSRVQVASESESGLQHRFK
jgi:hypothetical protein